MRFALCTVCLTYLKHSSESKLKGVLFCLAVFLLVLEECFIVSLPKEELNLSVSLNFFNHIFPTLLVLYKLSGNGLYPGRNWIMSLLEFINEGLKVSLASTGRLWVVDNGVCAVNHFGVIWFCSFTVSLKYLQAFVLVTGISHPVLLDTCPFLEELQ